MFERRLTRRRFLGAAAMAATGLGLKYALPDSALGISLPPPLSHAPVPQGLRHLAWVWQFKADGEPDAIASVLAENSLGILLKTHDGTDWMSRWDRSMHAVSGPRQVGKLVNYFESSGVPFHAWHVAEGIDPVREAEMCAQVLAAGARSLTVDLEPFDGFWSGTPESALAFGREFRRLRPLDALYVCVDPRPWIMRSTPVAEFASFSQGFAPMAYWDTFKSPDNVDLFRANGFSPGDGGVTPEFVLDVSNSVLGPFGLPIYPAGDGTSSNTDDWTKFVLHARDLGMESVSVWRYGVTDERVWRLLKDMQRDLDSVETPGLKKGRAARVANTGICLTIYAKPSRKAGVVAYLVDSEVVTLTDDPVEAEGCRWWPVRIGNIEGWAPQSDPDGIPYLVPS